MNKAEEAEKDSMPKPAAKKREAKYIQPIVANYRRTKKGCALMRQELKRLLETQAKRMPGKALMDCEEKKVDYEYQGRKGSISVEKFLLKGPEFLDAFHTKIRKMILFGAKIQQWIQQVDDALRNYKHKPLQELIALVDAFEPASLKGYVEPEEDGEDEDHEDVEDAEMDDDGDDGE
jgi:hypothetical protein